MEIDSASIKKKDLEFLSTKEYDKLEQILQEINREFVRIEEDIQRRNLQCFNRCLGDMIRRMKEANQTFRAIFQEVKFTGSYYEGSRVGEPNEFDINFVLRQPFPFSVHEDNYTSAGYVQLKVTEPNQPNCNGTKNWVQHGFISAQAVIRWWEGVIASAFSIAGGQVIVDRMYSVSILSKSGPAITLRMQHINAKCKAEQIDIDFVPVFEFQHPTWPRKTRRIPSSCNKSTKWCVTPKVANNPSFWRLSFAFHEKEMILDKPNLKNVYRFMKRLRDSSVNLKCIKSYHIKTLFLWKVDQLETSEWRKPLGRLFMMMLYEFETCLKRGQIPLFWDKKMNMIGQLNTGLRSGMFRQILYIRIKIYTLLKSNDTSELQKYMRVLFTEGPTRI